MSTVANAFHLYRRLFRYMRRYWWALVLAGIATMIYSGVDAWFIYFLKPLLNKGLVDKNKHFLYFAPFLVMLVFMLRGVASFFSNYYIAVASRRVIMRLRQDLFAHYQQLPARFYDQTTSGQMLSVLLYCVDQIANAGADVLTSALQAICLIVGLVIVMISISWKLTLLYFLLAPLVTIVMRYSSLRVRRLSLGIQDSIGDLSHIAEENVEAYKIVRAFQGQPYEINKFNIAANVNRQREMKVVVARSASVCATQFITAIALALTLYIATLDISAAILTPGGFVAMIAAMLALLKPMKDMAMVQNKLYRGLAGAQKVFEVLDEDIEKDTGTCTLQRARGHIVFANVNFQYQPNQPVLKNVSFEIKPGEVVALVGKSGGGKSTLTSLLSRYYDCDSGEILLDGVNIRDYQLNELRKQFALVTQQVTLFHDTIFNNIAYGQFGAQKEAVLAAAEAAHVKELIESLPDKENTLIGENGVLLSGGQRQRLAIARALLKDAPILILDEATSALDNESERYIQAALEKLMKNRTTLIIAHRLSTIERADKIVVIEHGSVVEVGSHAELLTRGGQYAKLHALQFQPLLQS